MQTTLELVHDLSDSQVIEVAKELFNTVYANVPFDQVRKNSEGAVDVGELVALNDEVKQQDLSPTDSARFGRLVLEQYARDPELGPLVHQAWNKVESSDELIVDVLLALGLVVNLTLLVATTKIELQNLPDGKIRWKIVKRDAPPELVGSVLKPLAKLASRLGVGG
jgi:hypothetical protein